ncbi:hypothetical protein [Virgibacillus profundi]|uniref:hypothetical protein n=1 Tax=Virgibacillus profundi TaxID=2024555 RepID=UPI0013FD23D3|nr:hypothetical protein [Virgibacillus profundi]
MSEQVAYTSMLQKMISEVEHHNIQTAGELVQILIDELSSKNLNENNHSLAE